MSTLSSANVTDVNLVLKERTHMRLCINMLIFTHNIGNWLIRTVKQRKTHTVNDLNRVMAAILQYYKVRVHGGCEMVEFVVGCMHYEISN